MKLYRSRTKNFLYFFYRIINQIIDPIKFIQGLYGYFWFLRDLCLFKYKDSSIRVSINNLFPMLHDKKKLTPFDAHYFFQQLLIFEKILKEKPIQHIDVGSSYLLSGYLSKIVKTVFVDIRPIEVDLKNFSSKRGDILNLPFNNDSVESLSCLHVIEHIGLGRYGDEINPSGMEQACRELVRILKPGGLLYISTPIGQDRICFNAHRVSSVNKIICYFEGLDLLSFSYVDENGKFYENKNLEEYSEGQYDCGIFEFVKNKKLINL